MSRASHVILILYGASKPFDRRYSRFTTYNAPRFPCLPFPCERDRTSRAQCFLLALLACSEYHSYPDNGDGFLSTTREYAIFFMALFDVTMGACWLTALVCYAFDFLHLPGGRVGLLVTVLRFHCLHQLWPCTGLASLNGYWHSCFLHQTFAVFHYKVTGALNHNFFLLCKN